MSEPGRVVGVDVGGTKVALGWIEDDEFTLGPEHPTNLEEGPEGLVDQLVAVIGEVSGEAPRAAGFGIPSVIDWETGRVKSSTNIPLKDVELRSVLTEKLGIPAFVDNDATVAALAEAHDGRRFVHSDLVMFTVGTGVGGGLVLGGRVYRGRTGAAGELGHTLIGAYLVEGAPPPGDRFPQPGSLERLAAGRALDGMAAESAATHRDSALGRIIHEGKVVLGPQAVQAAHDGDEEAVRLLRVLGERLGVGIANAINTFDPEVVVVGGGLARAGDLLLAPAREAAREYVLPGVGEKTEIRLARHGPEAGVRGAALLAAQELELAR